MKKPNIAIILYTVREPAKQDLVGTLKRLRDIGWEYVQWSGMPPVSADEARAALDEAGLRAVAGHIDATAFEKDFEGQVAFWKTVGATDIAPVVAFLLSDGSGWLRGANLPVDGGMSSRIG